jgi:hypothetical protein
MTEIQHLLSDYKNKHEGEDIYVLASGKSYDYYPSTFFDNRVTIGVNQMSQLRPCTYAVRKEIAPGCIDTALNGFLANVLFLSVGTGGDAGTANQQLMEQPEHNHLLSTGRVVLFNHAKNVRIVPNRLPTDPNTLVVSWSTVTTAIHLAAHMGARAVYLVGHDCGTLDGELNCTGYHTIQTLRPKWGAGGRRVERYTSWLHAIEKDTSKLRGLLSDLYGCHVVSLSPFVGLGMEEHTYHKHEPS